VLADLDLHVIDPTGTEIYWEAPGPTAAGGVLGGDADQDCKASPGGHKEVIQWPATSPNGAYVVRLDFYENCGTPSANYTITISDGKTTLPAVTGSIAASGAGDVGALGSGVTVKTFSHVGNSFQ
jgi:uncharacterized protein YfaP (DUF2135 family)